jgi:uncharacterized protein DUF2154
MNGNNFRSDGYSDTEMLDPPQQGAVATSESPVAHVNIQPAMERPSYPQSPPVPVSQIDHTAEPIPHQPRVVVRQGANPVLVTILVVIGAVVVLGLAFLVAGLLLFSNIVSRVTSPPVGNLTIDTQSVTQGEASSALVDVSMGVGNLTISGSATDLMNATFTYNIDTWKPLVSYNVNGTEGTLLVRQPNSNNISTAPGTRNDWDLRFKNDVPMTMNVGLGVGQGNLKLSGLNLTRLEVNNGVGDSTIDMSGQWNQDTSVLVNGGVGKVTLILPAQTGVRVTTDGGLGKVSANGFNANGTTYTNDSYGKSPHTINVDVKTGIGDIQLVQGR